MSYPYNFDMMNMTKHHLIYPDRIGVSSELVMDGRWDARAVSELIRTKCANGDVPSFLFLGRKEAALLKEHLAEVFGEDSVITLNGTYYMGLSVKTINCESFFAIGGSKTHRTQSTPSCLEWRDGGSRAAWRFWI